MLDGSLRRLGLRADQSVSTVDRVVYANNPQRNVGFVDNLVITSKYNVVNFLPLFLLEAFSRMANAYFLLVCVLQSISAISITGGVPTSALPLSIVLFFDGSATAREDYKRHVDDAHANNSKTLVMRNGDFLEVAWRDITVGDLLKVRRNEVVPADAVFLSSHSEDNSAADTCYVQTAQLDGETNLKLRSCAAATAAAFKAGDRAAAAFRGRVQCEAPNASFDKFTGLLFTEERAGGAGIPLEAENLLLRGSMLRNVDFCYALAVYTGRETKVRVRQTTRPQKVAQVESQLNKFILCLVGLLLCLCLAGTVGHVLWTQASAKHFYLGVYANSVGATLGVGHFFTFFLLNASFIPVSLYVTVRLSRSLQMLFMEWDAEMVHEEPDLLAATNGEEGRFPLRVRSMELNDELGQITHIFSDKTGTLTLNYMEFRKLLVNGRAYGLGTTQIGIDRMRRMGVDVRALEGALAAEKLRGRERGAQLPHVNFEDGSETHEGHTIGSDSRNPADGDQGSAIHDLLLHLSLNHTVLPEVMRDRGGRVTGTKLSAASPDEEAFCYAAETLGYKFLSRSQTGVCLRVRHAAKAMPFVTVPGPLPAAVLAASAAHAVGTKMSAKTAAEEGGVDVPFAVLNTLAYTQERKCMSVIVEHPVFDAATGGLAVTGGAGGTPRGHIFLYTKGADSAILPKCLPPAGAVEEEAHRRTKAVLSEWGNDGLRTLVFACRRVPREVYEPWAARYAAATQNLEELKKKKDKRPNLIDDLQRELEVDLTLQGATANEDKLQPEVPETIEQLAKAGIKIWMVTGDKQETAVNIGFATRLLTNQQRLVMCTMESAGGVQQAMKRLRVAWKRMKLEKEGRADGARALSFNPPTPTPPMSPGIALGPEEVQTGAKSGKGGAPRDALDAPGVNAVLNPASISRGDADDFAEDGDEWDLAAGPLYEAAMGHEPTAEQKNTHGDGGGAGAAGTANGLMSTPSGSMASSNPFFGGGVAGAGRSEAKRPFALVIDEHCLDEALRLKKGRDYLLGVSAACDAVVACRARPDQKARIVRLVRSGISTTRTLAVGDGANDVDMICNAHVGVGIAGAEGVQAANASDYSIGRFRFLQRLLLVHGRWNYLRMSLVVLYMFWKNVVFVVAQFFFQTNNGFSGQKWYVEFAAQAYNIVFTGLPPLAMGVYDRDVDAKWALKFPKLYDHGRLSRALNLRVFLAWMADALFNAVVVAGFTMGGHTVPEHVVASGAEGNAGTPFVFDMGTMAYSIVLAAVTIRIVAETHKHSALFRWCIILSTVSWVPANFLLDYLRQDGMEGRMRLVFGSAQFWLLLLLAAGLFTVRVCAWKGLLRMWSPELRHVVCEVNAGVAGRNGEKSADWFANLADAARKQGKTVQQVARDTKTGSEPPLVRVHQGAADAPWERAQLAGGPASATRLPLLSGASGGSSAAAVGFISSSPAKGSGGGVDAPYTKLPQSPPNTPVGDLRNLLVRIDSDGIVRDVKDDPKQPPLLPKPPKVGTNSNSDVFPPSSLE